MRVPGVGERGGVQFVASDAGRAMTVMGSPKRNPSTKEVRQATELALAKSTELFRLGAAER